MTVFTMPTYLLRDLRTKYLNLTLEKVGKYSGVSASSVRRIELGYEVSEELEYNLREFYCRYGQALIEYRRSNQC